MGRNNVVPFDIEKTPSLEEPTTYELEGLLSLPSTSIYRIPKLLRHINKKAYKLKVVSIGPLHHGRKDLQAMEQHKRRYLDNLTCLTKVSLDSYREVVRQQEKKLRACYADTIRFSSDKFVDIILVDAAFIIGFLLGLRFREMRDEEDCIFGKPWTAQYVWPDFLLLENQLPFFILKDLFEHRTTYSINHGERVGIFELSHYFFKELMNVEVTKGKLAEIRSANIKHFVDFLRRLYLPWNEADIGKLQTTTIPSITELQRAGVRFKASKNLFDLKFRNGVLEIPKLITRRETEISILNLLAFEQCYCENNCINNYVVLMSRLINTEKDVDLLIEYGIVENRLNNNKQEPFLMRKLEDGAILDVDKIYFASLCEKLNNYCRTPWHKLKAYLKQNYLCTSWATVSIIAGVTSLMLSLIQTVCLVIFAKSFNPQNGSIEASQFHYSMTVVSDYGAVALLVCLYLLSLNVVPVLYFCQKLVFLCNN